MVVSVPSWWTCRRRWRGSRRPPPARPGPGSAPALPDCRVGHHWCSSSVSFLPLLTRQGPPRVDPPIDLRARRRRSLLTRWPTPSSDQGGASHDRDHDRGRRVPPARRQAPPRAPVQAEGRRSLPDDGGSARRRLVQRQPDQRRGHQRAPRERAASSWRRWTSACRPDAGYPASLADIHYGDPLAQVAGARLNGRADRVGAIGISSGGHQGMLLAHAAYRPALRGAARSPRARPRRMPGSAAWCSAGRSSIPSPAITTPRSSRRAARPTLRSWTACCRCTTSTGPARRPWPRAIPSSRWSAASRSRRRPRSTCRAPGRRPSASRPRPLRRGLSQGRRPGGAGALRGRGGRFRQSQAELARRGASDLAHRRVRATSSSDSRVRAGRRGAR